MSSTTKMRWSSSRFVHPRHLVAITLVALAWSGLALGGEIHEAAKRGDLERVKALLKADPNLVFSYDENGATPLHCAVRFHQRDMAALLLAHKANVNAKDNEFPYSQGGGRWPKPIGGTPLHWAASMGDYDMVEWVLTHGADVNARDNGGQTPLYKAGMDVAKVLLAHKADVNAKDDHGDTPLHLVARGQGKEMADLLLANGAEVNARNNDGDTPLHLAAKYCPGFLATVELLLARGADVNARDKQGDTPLTIPKDYGCPNLTDLLQRHGGRDALPGDNDIVDAAWNGDAVAVKALLKKNPRQVSRKGKGGNTALHWAAFNGLTNLVELLLANHAPVNARNNDGWTPLHWAAYRGQKDVAELLLAHKAQVNAKANDGATPLHWAAWCGSQDMAELLLANRAEVNAKDHDGETPLAWAERHRHEAVADSLLANGAGGQTSRGTARSSAAVTGR